MNSGWFVQVASGALFGVALGASGAANFDAMTRMFLFEEAHLFALAGVTTLVAAVGLRWLSKSSWGAGVRALPRPVHLGSVPGAVIFGLGWGLSGACPGTVLVLLGSGHLIALLVLVGVLLGNWLFDRFLASRVPLGQDSCN